MRRAVILENDGPRTASDRTNKEINIKVNKHEDVKFAYCARASIV